MNRARAAIGSAAFFVLAPGIVMGLVPWVLTGWRFLDPVPYWAPVRVAGAALLGQLGLLVYGAVVGAASVAFVHLYEEPALRRRFGEPYEQYLRDVPGWLPRRGRWTAHKSVGGKR